MVQACKTAFYLQDNDKQTKDQHAAKQNTKQQSPKQQSVSHVAQKGLEHQHEAKQNTKAAATRTAGYVSSLPRTGIKTQVNNIDSH